MSAYEFKLPDVGEGLREGEIIRWHAAPGDEVQAHQSLVDVQTDKAIVEIPAPVTGTLKRLGGDPGDIIAVGAVLAVIERGPSPAEGEALPVSRVLSPPPPPLPSRPTSTSGGRVQASPAVRKLARERGVELARISGTGRRGQVTREDVEAAVADARPASAIETAAPVTAAGEDRIEPLRGLRRRIAQTMAAAWREVPHIFSMRDIDATDLVRARESVNAVFPAPGPRDGASQEHRRPCPIPGCEHVFQGSRGGWDAHVGALGKHPDWYSEIEDPDKRKRRFEAEYSWWFEDRIHRLSYLPFFVQACAAALRAHSRFNASLDIDAGQIVYHHRCDIGIATATPEGLIVTVVRDADRKSLRELSGETSHLAALARARKISPAQITGGTFTISNYGSYGSGVGAPIIRPPEVAIAGFGRVDEAVIPIGGLPRVRSVLPLCVSTDHRLNDGEHLGAFVDSIARHLSEPALLLAHV